jgi:phytanoyl-CoA hydroxylase
MWIDRIDFLEQLSRRIRIGELSERVGADILTFEKKGVVVLEKAASDEELARFEAAISVAFRDGHSDLLYQAPGKTESARVTAGLNRRGTRVVDAYAVLPEALDLLSTPRLVEVLKIILGERPKLFQSLSFDMGSEQGLHQDTAYVVVDRPMEFVGCWIALEDVNVGSGELQYMIGSHRLPDYEFRGNKKHWDMSIDGLESHNAWAKWILEEGGRRGLPIESFLAQRGDILIWHADLAHGGSLITRSDCTRKSLVGHFCPESAVPNYVRYAPDRSVAMSHRGISYSSWYYDLTALRNFVSAL